VSSPSLPSSPDSPTNKSCDYEHDYEYTYSGPT
jgi:hypothetical protein